MSRRWLSRRIFRWPHICGLFDAPDLLNESDKEDEELSLDKGLSHANPLPMAERYKVFRSEELSLFVKKPFKSIKSRLDDIKITFLA